MQVFPRNSLIFYIGKYSSCSFSMQCIFIGFHDAPSHFSWFGGLILDLKRKAPWYLSDFTDSLNLQCLASFFFMFFALLAPIVTFGGLLEEETGGYMVSF